MKTIPENSLAKLLNLIKTNYFRKSESQEVSAISIDVTPTDSSTNLVTSGGVKTELDKLGQAQTDIYSRIGDIEESILAVAGSWTEQQVALLETIFANIAYIDTTTGQTAANRLIASLRSGGWTSAQISLLEVILSNIAYIDTTTGQTASDRLIASLRGSGTGTSDDISQSGSVLTIRALANTPTQSESVLSIT